MAEKRPVTTLLIGLGGSGAWTVVHVKRQLYDAYDNRVPSNIALAVLDTAVTQITGFGTDTVERKPGQGIGRTVLDRTETAHVGGDAWELVNEVDRTENYPHIKSWFLTNRFLKDLPKSLFALDQGAGQFRQFGRLALFRDIMTPSTSSVAAIIDNKLRALAQEQRTGDPAISVMFVGSLAGGTGAGLFIDLPHLVQRVAAINNIEITLRGFFYLPQAFRASLNPQELEPARTRAGAALRELNRFLLNSDYEYGYPMHYHGPRSGVNQQLWRSENRGKLYDFVYLVDGEGQPSMNSYKLENGSASVVADAIINFIDENYGPKHNQYDINTRGKIQDVQGERGKQAYVSALGAYSIIMPIQQIIEGWAYRLSRDILLRLIPAENYSERGYITAISRRDNPDQGVNSPYDEIRRIAKSYPPVTDPNNEDRQLVPLPLWGKVFDVADAKDTEQNAIRRLSSYDLIDWLEMLVPPTTQTDPDVMRILQATARVLQDNVFEHVDTSDDKDGGDPSRDWQEIKARAEGFMNRQLGMPASGGGRQGGQYREALDRLGDLQVQRYSEYMTAYIHRELNGEARQDIMTAKAGKLGWLLAVIREFEDLIAYNGQLLDKVIGGDGSLSHSNRRADVEENYNNGLRIMQEKKDVRGLLIRRTAEAVQAQKSYVHAVDDYVNFYRMEFARGEVAQTLKRLNDFNQEVLKELNLWIDILATDVNSLHSKLLDGERSVRSDRQHGADLANHRIIDDLEWENNRFALYAQRDVYENLLRSWQWHAEQVPAGSTQRFSLTAGMRIGDNVEQFRKDIERASSQWMKDNHDLIMSLCRKVFRSAIEQESILSYLMDHYQTADLADELTKMSGYQLALKNNADTGSMIPGNILLAKHDDKQPQQKKYLQEILIGLAANKNQGDVSGQDNPTQVFESCADPFRMTLLSTAELIPLVGLRAYDDCMGKYWEVPYDTRQKNHIFPAEVNVVDYERQLGNLKQMPRMLADRVTLLVEDESRFNDFLFLLTHRMIETREIEEGRGISYYWSLIVPHRDPRHKGKIEEWKLSSPGGDRPSLMEAALRYIVIGEDVENSAHKIDYDHVIKSLRLIQDVDTSDRIDRDEIALEDSELRNWYEAFLPPIVNGEEDLSNWTDDDDAQYLNVARLIVRHDMMQELVTELRAQVDSLGANAKAAKNSASTGVAHDDALEKQELYDLFSISIIGLEKEIFNYRDLIKDRYLVRTKAKRGRV